jgi:hypothetical protein
MAQKVVTALPKVEAEVTGEGASPEIVGQIVLQVRKEGARQVEQAKAIPAMAALDHSGVN